MKTYTIDYKKHFWNDWTVYRQLIKIDSELMNLYNSELQKKYDKINYYSDLNKTINNSDMNFLSYTKKLEKWINYIHITWLYFLDKILYLNWLESKRLKLNRNTIIEVL